LYSTFIYRFPQAWKDSTIFVSTTPFDPFSWTRKLDTVYDEETATLSWTHTHEPHLGYTEEESTSISSSRENGNRSSSSSSVYFAYFPPYSYQRHLNLLARISALAATSSSNVAVYSLGQTLDGREIDCIQMGTGSRTCWIIHRQHPGETMAEFYAEGLLQRLIGLDNGEGGGHGDAWMDTFTTTTQLDPVTQQALNLYTFYIVPNMNLDGSVRGYLRTNAGGQNLNREWTRSSFTKEGAIIPYEAPTLERSPEVYHVLNKIQQTGVDVFLDVHGDEELPFNFVSGAEGCSTGSPRMEAVQGAFLGAYCRANSDMQKQVSYDPELPAQARINVASNYIATAYDCLALTLEMPFKDCLTHRDPIYGWSPARCKKLGASVVDALIHVHPILRDYETEFWKKLDDDDLYIRPSSNYEHL
jgi:murein tripeptide amidase MpaA